MSRNKAHQIRKITFTEDALYYSEQLGKIEKDIKAGKTIGGHHLQILNSTRSLLMDFYDYFDHEKYKAKTKKPIFHLVPSP